MSDLRRLSDEDLLLLTRREPEAFGVFYERHWRRVLRFLARSTRDEQAALDLTAEVFAAALAGSERYRPRQAAPQAWLFGIAKNKLLMYRRQHAVALSAQQRLAAEVGRDGEAIEVEHLLPDRSQEELARAMATLSPSEREAVTARVIEERSYAEIAAQTGCSEAAVRQRVSRGLAKLRLPDRQV